MQIFALTTRGLEDVTAAELAALPGAAVADIAYRRVAAEIADPAPLLGLRTADDVFASAATWDGIARPRTTLTTLERLSRALDLRDAAAACAELRDFARPPTFAVTASFVGKRNYSTDEIKLAVAAGVEHSHGWSYSADDGAADLNLRVFIEHEVAFVGVRLGQTALHARPYKLEHLAGSLKPPVAAALIHLAGAAAGLRLVDPCCGAGTVLIEAALLGLAARGGDLDPAAVAAAQRNVAAAAVSVSVEQWDAAALPLADGSADRAVTNLPWGRQVVADGALATLYRQTLAELGRVLVPGGQAATLTTSPALVAAPGLAVVHQRENQLVWPDADRGPAGAPRRLSGPLTRRPAAAAGWAAPPAPAGCCPAARPAAVARGPAAAQPARRRSAGPAPPAAPKTRPRAPPSR